MDENRPLLIGMNSPQSERPEDALRVWNSSCAGGRLYDMLANEAFARDGVELTHDDYHQRFERVNLLDSVTWHPKRAAQIGAPRVLEKMLGRVSVICGVATLKALGLERRDWFEWNPPGDENRYCLIPHPSGLTREYNSFGTRLRAGELLYGLYSGRTIAELAASVE